MFSLTCSALWIHVEIISLLLWILPCGLANKIFHFFCKAYLHLWWTVSSTGAFLRKSIIPSYSRNHFLVIQINLKILYFSHMFIAFFLRLLLVEPWFRSPALAYFRMRSNLSKRIKSDAVLWSLKLNHESEYQCFWISDKYKKTLAQNLCCTRVYRYWDPNVAKSFQWHS